jgi:hypothetical protein
MIVATIVPLEYIELVWPKIEGFLDGAARYTYGRFTVDDIKNSVLTTDQQLWVAYDDKTEEPYGAVVTQVLTYPRMKSLVMHFTGGIELPKWKDQMLDLLQRFAKDNGCVVIESYGRDGWEKVFKDDGFRKRFMFYELPVEKLDE